MHTVLGEQENEVSSSTVAQWLTALEEKLGEIATHLCKKKRVKKVGEREVVQCFNDNCFSGLDIDIDLASSLFGCQIVRDAPNIVKKIAKHCAI